MAELTFGGQKGRSIPLASRFSFLSFGSFEVGGGLQKIKKIGYRFFLFFFLGIFRFMNNRILSRFIFHHSHNLFLFLAQGLISLREE